MTKIIVKKEIAGMTKGAILTKSSNGGYRAYVNNSSAFDELMIHEDFIELLPEYFMKDEGSVWNEDGRYLKADKQATVWIISQEGTIYNRTANQEMCDKIASGFLEGYRSAECAQKARYKKELLFKKELHDNGICDCDENGEGFEDFLVDKVKNAESGIERLFAKIMLDTLRDDKQKDNK